MTTATRVTNSARARNSSVATQVEAIKSDALHVQPIPVASPLTELASATSTAMDAMANAKGKIASLVLAIRSCRASGIKDEEIGAIMQRAAVMARLNVDSDKAQSMLDTSPRPAELKPVLDALKMAKSRAFAVLKEEDKRAAAGDTKPVTVREAKGAGKSKGAKLMDRIEVPAPINTEALAAQLLKCRTLLKTIAKQGMGLEGAEDMIRAAKAAAATLAIVED